ncbi:MAG: hypothetical protein KAJ19_13435 [Gammaproteobacteria bacterium]|nr:hypothetical protein [Gammaproteobacteria bacterium]
MKIHNVVEIHDNGEFITIITKSGSSIHLPPDSEHSITIKAMEDPGDHYTITVTVDLYQ